MNSFEFNKIFAAILCAGITAYIGAFIAKQLVHPHTPENNAVEIAGDAIESGGSAKAAMPEPILELIAAADVEKGAKLSKACAACHSFDQGGPTKVGPNLYSIVGAKKAHINGFEYSGAISSLGGKWDYLELNKFLWKPKAYAPGTKMNYNGVKKPEDRAALIAWLRTQGGAALPSAAEIAAEKAELALPEEESPEEESPAEEAAETVAH